jgi:hypothetical protein
VVFGEDAEQRAKLQPPLDLGNAVPFDTRVERKNSSAFLYFVSQTKVASSSKF